MIFIRFFAGMFFLLFSLQNFAQLTVSTLNTPVVMDFNSFGGSGFSPTPSSGQLDSDTWAFFGLSDGDIQFGGSGNTGDFARGTSSGGVSPGGVYAFDHGNGNYLFGVQPTSADFTPGEIMLRIQNLSGQTINYFDLSYEIWSYNDGGRSNYLYLYYSEDTITYTRVQSVDFATYELGNVNPYWDSIVMNTQITNLTIPDNGFFFLKWVSNDSLGVGTRDEMGLDNITITAGNEPLTAEFTTEDICLGDTAFFFDSSYTINGNIVSWQWDFGDTSGASNQQNPYYIYNYSGTYSVMLIVVNSNSDTDTVFHNITVHPLPVADFTFITNLLTVDFTDASQGAASWYWDFGDAATDTLQNPSHIYGSDGSYIVTLIVTSSFGCTDTVTDTVDVIGTDVPEAQMLKDVAIYPNPVINGSIFLDFGKGYNSATSIQIFDLVGNQIYEEHVSAFPQGKLRINLGGYSEGNYFILLQNASGRISHKFTIKP